MNILTDNTERVPGAGLVERETTRELDEAYATWTSRNFYRDANEDSKKLVERLAIAVSYALHLKHTCLDLANYARLCDPVLDELLEGIDAETVRGLNINIAGRGDAGDNAAPLLCSADGQLLWLQKYHVFEQAVADKIAQMNIKSAEDRITSELSTAQKEDLDHLYDAENKDQRNAVETTLFNRFSVITGGPGTGKTYTVARIITLMLRHGVGDRKNPRIALAAPTGKAANRMHQSLEDAFGTAEIQAMIAGFNRPEKATTLHSLLGIYRNSPKARHDSGNPLPLDVLIVDEASMVALPMIYRILQALPESAHLILLGDKDQLSSVEAGSVLGELCDTDKPYVATIRRSYRYENKPEIGALAEAINADPPSLPDFETNKYVIRSELTRAANTWAPQWLDGAVAQLQRLTSALENGMKAGDILKHQTDFQVLCALRKGPAGVLGINSMLESKLGHKAGGWYSGRPVMVLANDHQRNLYNGDVGLVMPVRKVAEEWVIDKDEGLLRACFPVGAQEVKTISMAQMPAFETCYAMTVHKSQGSEYKKVLFVLPEDREEVERNPVITKELVYTGVTRASEEVEIWCGKGVLEAAVNKQTVRMSGLAKH
jgi:exodeoxyribonuclease V alpha subunit